MKVLFPIPFLLALLQPLAVYAQEPDWRVYDALLKRHVSQHRQHNISLAWVNYPALAKDTAFKQMVKMLANFPTQHLTSRSEKLAFYINAYNVLTIKMILDHRPLKSIRDAGSLFGSVWKKTAGKLGGKTVTLDTIEHQILRPMGEPRIHMAIVCASLSCPDLRAEAYRAEQLEEQLETQTRAFLNNPGKGLAIQGKMVRLSKIFNWFRKDFTDLDNFLRKRRPDLPRGTRLDHFFTYDWSLNGNEK